MRLADRMSRLGTESAFEVLARVRALEAEGRKVIHLEIGEPDFDTPSHIVEAAAEALREGFTHYVAARACRRSGRRSLITSNGPAGRASPPTRWSSPLGRN